MNRLVTTLLPLLLLASAPAVAATKDEVKEAKVDYKEEVKLDKKFDAARKAWVKAREKAKSGPMEKAAAKVEAWIPAALEQVPRRVIADARAGEDDSVRGQYVTALTDLKQVIARTGGDGGERADDRIGDLLKDVGAAIDKRVAVRASRLERLKEELKASK